MNTKVAVIDYGMGNLHSIGKALEHVGAEVRITARREVVMAADRVVFPGVGAMRDCMGALVRSDLTEVVKEAAVAKPFLGICLGMQAMLDRSEENDGVDCLGLIPGEVRHFDQHPETMDLKIPHMGWNHVRSRTNHPMWTGIDQDARFYFVHSYYARPRESAHVAGTTAYGIEFASVSARDNLFASQFHPEKSQQAGLRLLTNFLTWNP